MNMNRLPLALTRTLALLALWLLTGTAAAQDAWSWHQVTENGGGHITLKYVASDGFAYYDDNGQLTGVTTEIFRDFVNWVESEHDLSLTVHYQPFDSWSDFYAAVRDAPDGTFGMGNVTITEARWNELDFSPAYMTNIAVLVSHEDTDELQQLAEMNTQFGHLTALAFEGTLHEARLRSFRDAWFSDMRISFAHSNNEIIERVASSDRYFAYVDVYNYWRARDAGAPIRQHRVGDEPSEQFGYIMPDSSDWEPVIRDFFESAGEDGYLESGRYQAIMQQHLGTGLATMLDEARRSLAR